MTSPGTSVPTEDGNPFPTRRELRAREAAAAAGAAGSNVESDVEAGAVTNGAAESHADSRIVEAVADANDVAQSCADAEAVADADAVEAVADANGAAESHADSHIVEAVADVPSTTDLRVEMVVAPVKRFGAARAKPQRSAPAAAPVAPVAPAARRAKGKNPAMVLVALVAIPGIFLTAALPAYAFSPNGEVAGGASASRSLTEAQAQAVSVDAASPALTVARDSFTATTREELDAREREAQRVAAAQAAIAAAALRSSLTSSSPSSDYAILGPRAEGDDYPWPYARTDEDGGGLSPLGYYYRECVDFVAWRLNRDAGSTGSPWAWTWGNLTPGGGNASSWKSQWDRHGWPTGDTPVVGAVAWFTYNHVAYVQSIPGDGTVVLEEYNWMHTHAYHTRTIPIGQVAKFLYPPS